jgi:hypothetical protein
MDPTPMKEITGAKGKPVAVFANNDVGAAALTLLTGGG